MNTDALESFLNTLGVTKTIYAYIHPETRDLIGQILADERISALDECEAAWTQRQDASHEDFLTLWSEWSGLTRTTPHTSLRTIFPYAYPTAGASEGLRQIILEHAARNPRSVLHSLYGDYEGARAYAASAGMPSCQWNDVDEGAPHFKAGDLFYISDPSAIDGEPHWARLLALNQLCLTSGVRLLLDLTYVGLQCSHPPTAPYVELAAVEWIVFSLSKPFGVYYWRIGGVFSRQEILGLKGNAYFKNLLSLRIGHRLLTRFAANHLAANLLTAQQAASNLINTQLTALTQQPWTVRPSAVPLLVNATRPACGSWSDVHPVEKYLARVQNGSDGRPADRAPSGFFRDQIHLRLCITPALTRATRGIVAGDASIQLRKIEK